MSYVPAPLRTSGYAPYGYGVPTTVAPAATRPLAVSVARPVNIP